MRMDLDDMPLNGRSPRSAVGMPSFQLPPPVIPPRAAPLFAPPTMKSSTLPKDPTKSPPPPPRIQLPSSPPLPDTESARNAAADASLLAAGTSAMANDWRGCADAYLAAYQTSSSTWQLRANSWSGYSSVLREGNTPVLPRDLEALRTVGADVRTPLLDRVQAHFTTGFLAFSRGDTAASRAGYALARRLAHEALDANDAALNGEVLMAASDGYRWQLVRTEVESLAKYAADNLIRVGPSVATDGAAPYSEVRGATNRAHLAHAHAPSAPRATHDEAGVVDEPVGGASSARASTHSFFEIAMHRRAVEALDAPMASTQHWHFPDGKAAARFGSVAVSVSGEQAVVHVAGENSSIRGSSGRGGGGISSSDGHGGGGGGGAVSVLSPTLRLTSPTYTAEFEQPLAIPQPSPRRCDVHSCVLLDSDAGCQSNRSCIATPRSGPSPLAGHLAPIGAQFESPISVRRAALDARTFYHERARPAGEGSKRRREAHTADRRGVRGVRLSLLSMCTPGLSHTPSHGPTQCAP